MDMFCYQCEQTSKGSGCTTFGICGKDPSTAALQDLTIQLAKEISFYAHKLNQMNIKFDEANLLTIDALFTTVTNVNFDPKRLQALIIKQINMLAKVKAPYLKVSQDNNQTPQHPEQTIGADSANSLDALIALGIKTTIANRTAAQNEDITGLHEMIIYGLKGMAAYYYHAIMLGFTNDALYDFFHEALAFLATHPDDISKLLAMALNLLISSG